MSTWSSYLPSWSSKPANSTENGHETASETTSGELGRNLEGIVAGRLAQTRYELLRGTGHNRLNLETVAGIKDMYLGKVKNGAKIGMLVIF